MATDVNVIDKLLVCGNAYERAMLMRSDLLNTLYQAVQIAEDEHHDAGELIEVLDRARGLVE